MQVNKSKNISRVSRKERKNFADSKFFQNIKNKKEVDSSFWFQKAQLWLQVSFGYNNPLNVGKVHSEMFLFNKYSETLFNKIEYKHLVFLGVGNGDTEMLVIDEVFNKFNDIGSISGVDVNMEFLDLFDNSIELRDLELKNNDFELIKINEDFGQLKIEDFPDAVKNEKKLICILGNTIGNYNNTNEIFDVIDKISKKGDQLLLSYQLNTHIEEVFKKYKYNDYFLQFITHYMYMEKDDYKYIDWKINKKNSSIEAWLDDIQIFRSRKFPMGEIEEISKDFSFKTKTIVTDDIKNLAIHLLEKK